ncbi:abortive infection system antitoxin AbiGi family protein [Priestia aryabhattai]|uniref:abortive infection system antitoxin AbiGi family protein n=1 Tax=Priestia aryabhattai TaxID=412384 RepID=UPI003736CC1D
MTQTVRNEEFKEVIRLKESPTVDKLFTRPKQSANVLFKCMSRLEYLKEILDKQAIMPRYYEEKIDYLNIEGLDKIAFPMSCFCDIHLNKLVDHMQNYGWFAIGLSKEWGIKKGIQPIHYINGYSVLTKDFSSIFNSAMGKNQNERNVYSAYHNYLLIDLLFMKPLEGKMITNEGYEHRNFHDEKEWRFIPNINEDDRDLPLIIPQEQMNPKGYNTYSDVIQKRDDLWLEFELNVIKYIIVSDQNAKKELITFLRENKKSENIDEIIDLCSKVLVFDELREDW